MVPQNLPFIRIASQPVNYKYGPFLGMLADIGEDLYTLMIPSIQGEFEKTILTVRLSDFFPYFSDCLL